MPHGLLMNFPYSRFTKKDQWNFFSYKAGFRLDDLPVSQSFSSQPSSPILILLHFSIMYPLLLSRMQGYNLGYYLKDNSREWYVALDYRPVRTLDINLSFIDAIRGPDYTELGANRVGNPPLAFVQWHNTSYGLKASYQVINDLYTWLSFDITAISRAMQGGVRSIFSGRRIR